MRCVDPTVALESPSWNWVRCPSVDSTEACEEVRAVTIGRSIIQRSVDAVAAAQTRNQLLRSWLQLNDDLAALGRNALCSLGEPAWPENRERAALAAASFSYRYGRLRIDAPDWLDSPHLVAASPVCPVPEVAEIAKPLTPDIVARHNVICDESSFESV